MHAGCDPEISFQPCWVGSPSKTPPVFLFATALTFAALSLHLVQVGVNRPLLLCVQVPFKACLERWAGGANLEGCSLHQHVSVLAFQVPVTACLER